MRFRYAKLIIRAGYVSSVDGEPEDIAFLQGELNEQTVSEVEGLNVLGTLGYDIYDIERYNVGKTPYKAILLKMSFE